MRAHNMAASARHQIDLSGTRPGTSRGTTLGSDRNLPEKTSEQPAPSTEGKSKDKDMGAALRSVYQQTVDEAVPEEMLDLLGKLD